MVNFEFKSWSHSSLYHFLSVYFSFNSYFIFTERWHRFFWLGWKMAHLLVGSGWDDGSFLGWLMADLLGWLLGWEDCSFVGWLLWRRFILYCLLFFLFAFPSRSTKFWFFFCFPLCLPSLDYFRDCVSLCGVDLGCM